MAWSASQPAIGGAAPVKHMTITDDVQYGLHAKIRKTGGITFHVSYTLPSEDDEDGNPRPFLLVGRHPETTVAKARARAETVRVLAEMAPKRACMRGCCASWTRRGRSGGREPTLALAVRAGSALVGLCRDCHPTPYHAFTHAGYALDSKEVRAQPCFQSKEVRTWKPIRGLIGFASRRVIWQKIWVRSGRTM